MLQTHSVMLPMEIYPPFVYLLRFLILCILVKDNGEMKILPVQLFLNVEKNWVALIGITKHLPHIR